MVDLPPSLVIGSVTNPCIIHFKDVKHASDAPPHYYVAVPLNDDVSLLLCIITSQIEKRTTFYSKSNKTAISCLVPVDKHALPFLTRESIIECNQPEVLPKEELVKRVNPKHKFNVTQRDIPPDLKGKVLDAIKRSPLVEPFIKKMVEKAK
ncbi:MAG: hypothetical protein Q7T53_00235 [Deltaproteobacteria bacterium]|nr:hypothetical protein [Deltaproteobacteria bacterium]